MKISLNWVKEFTSIDMPIAELVEKIGAQLGAVDEVIDWGARYDGIVVAKVVSCVKHPNADKLSHCVIDDGRAVQDVNRRDDGSIEVVCGAPNVADGQLVAYIPPGVVVPSTVGKEEFRLEAREIRGIVSNGMLASLSELGISNDHTGILVIDPSEVGEELAVPGTDFKRLYALDDTIIDIENKMFTHRPDCFGMLGVARELAGIQGQEFRSPSWYMEEPNPISHPSDIKVEVVNEVPELVPRFVVVPISGVKVGPSPIWLQSKLSRVGIKPINNVVDVTNLYMVETGQPLHAYDADKLKTNKILVRLSKVGETLRLLGGKELKLQDGSLIITDGDKPIGLAGVMGGADTEVDDTTKNIIVECGTFDMNATRRSSMTYGLFTDAATRFTKGQSPRQNMAVVAKAVDDFEKLTGGKVAGEVVDIKTGITELGHIEISAANINNLLGLSLNVDEVSKILKNVGFAVKLNDASANILWVIPPFWRTDIEIPEDIVEEVGRLYGYDKLPLSLPPRDLSPAPKNSLLDLKQQLRNIMANSGANEVLTYSFVHGSLLQKVGQELKDAYKVRNALSPDLQYYRLSLMPSLLEKVHPNIKLGFDKFVLYEIGKSHNKIHPTDGDEQVPREFDALAAVYAASDAAHSDAGAAFYNLRVFLDNLAREFGVDFIYAPIPMDMPDMPVTKPYDLSRSAAVIIKQTQIFIGIIGELRQEVGTELKLPKYCAGFEIGIKEMLEGVPHKSSYKPMPKYPKIQQDITLKVPKGKNFAEVLSCLEKKLGDNQPEHTEAGFEPVSIYTKDEESTNFSFRLTIASHEKTLLAEEVNTMLDKIAADCSQEIGSERV